MKAEKVMVMVIMFGLACFTASADILNEFYLMDGVLISVDEPYHIEAYPDDQTYFYVSDESGNAADVFVLYDEWGGGSLRPVDAMIVTSRMFSLDYYTEETAAENGEVYSIFKDPTRSSPDGYIMFVGVGEQGFFAYGFDISGSPGGYVLALLLLAMPEEGEEGLQDIVEHMHVEIMEAAG